MYQNPKFGYITNNDKRKFYLLLDALKYSKIISIDENNYNAINLLKDNLSENNYKEIYASIKL
jgi:Cys-tRNA synthase (O-phospho-L-seryl-tRNA:Cys-tRNA synthase)